MDIAVDKVRTLILEARRIDVKEGTTDPDSGSNAVDDGSTDVLTSTAAEDPADGDAVALEFRGLIEALNEDERASLIALVYVGRGDFDIDEWNDAVALARDRDDPRTASRWLLGIPNLPDLLEEGLAAQGVGMVEQGTEPGDDDAATETDAPAGDLDDRVEVVRGGRVVEVR